jgi:adducin
MNTTHVNDGMIESFVASNRPPKYTPVEWELRCKLAVAYRVADYFGWTQVIFNHITVKIPGSEKEADGPHFLINPLGLRFEEITASCMLKVTISGEIVDKGTGAGGLFRQGYVIHSAIHEARHDVMCCWHSHHENAAAIAITKVGILPISQESCDIYPLIAYHPFEGTASDMGERPRMQKNLGPTKPILMLENHGPVTCGSTIEQAFFLMYLLCRSCNYQQKAMSAVGGDLSKLNIPSEAQLKTMLNRTNTNVHNNKKTRTFKDGGGGVPPPELAFRAIARLIEERDGIENIYC